MGMFLLHCKNKNDFQPYLLLNFTYLCMSTVKGICEPLNILLALQVLDYIYYSKLTIHI